MIHSQKDDRVAVMRGPVVFSRDENMDCNFDSPVDLVSDNGIMEIEQETPLYDTVWQQIKVPTSEGSIRMVDYASINNWNGLRTCTWLSTKGKS